MKCASHLANILHKTTAVHVHFLLLSSLLKHVQTHHMPRSIPSLYSMLFGAYAFSAHLFWRSRDVNTYLQHEMQIAVFYCFECCRLPLYKLQTKYYVESERESESKTATIYARPALHVVSSRSISNEPTAKTSCSNSFKLFYTYASVRRATPFPLKQTSGFFYTVWMCACLCE